MGMKKTFYGFAIGLAVLFLASGALAATELTKLTFDSNVTMQYPVDASNNPTQDFSKIVGFYTMSDLLYEGTKVAEVTATWMLKLPFDLTRLFDELTLTGSLIVPGFGQCSMAGQAVSMAVGDPTLGNMALKWVTNLTNCTGGLMGFEGVVDGGGTDNIFDQTFSSDHYKVNMSLQYLPQ